MEIYNQHWQANRIQITSWSWHIFHFSGYDAYKLLRLSSKGLILAFHISLSFQCIHQVIKVTIFNREIHIIIIIIGIIALDATTTARRCRLLVPPRPLLAFAIIIIAFASSIPRRISGGRLGSRGGFGLVRIVGSRIFETPSIVVFYAAIEPIFEGVYYVVAVARATIAAELSTLCFVVYTEIGCCNETWSGAK